MIKLLVVDDDEDLLELMELMLQANKIEVRILQDSKVFWEKLEAEKPDVLLMDIYMNGNDGRVICRKMKESEKFSAIPVLLYSAGTLPATSIEECRADAFLQKPFDMMELVRKIQTLAESRK